jgi:hypothetical protein
MATTDNNYEYLGGTPGGGGGGGGTVTSVGLALPSSLFTVTGSPVTGAGTLMGALMTQAANTVFAGPASGAAGVPTFRALVAADLPPSVQPAFYTEWHVNGLYSGPMTGSYNQPFNTIQAAVNAAQAYGGANSNVILHGTGTTENVVINNYTFNLQIGCFCRTAVDSQLFNLNGSITISGSSTRIRLVDFKVVVPGGASPDLIDSATGGRNYFSNMGFEGGGGIQFSGSWARWHEFTDCTVSGPISVAGTPAAGSQVSFWRLRGNPTLTLNATNAQVQMYDSFGGGNITQTAGVLLIDGGRNWPVGTVFASTTNGAGDLFQLTNANLETGAGTFVTVNKTGTSPYLISNVLYNETANTLNGTRVNQGASALDQRYVPATPGNWSPTPASTKEALDQLAARPVGGGFNIKQQVFTGPGNTYTVATSESGTTYMLSGTAAALNITLPSTAASAIPYQWTFTHISGSDGPTSGSTYTVTLPAGYVIHAAGASYSHTYTSVQKGASITVQNLTNTGDFIIIASTGTWTGA